MQLISDKFHSNDNPPSPSAKTNQKIPGHRGSSSARGVFFQDVSDLLLLDERGIFARERNYLWENKNDSKLLIVVINLKSCVVSTFEN